MIVSDALRCIFVHIQKTGGTSIEQSLRDADPTIRGNLYGGDRHIPAVEARWIVGPQRWRDYFKFAFVRNPWDRLVSWHRMCLDVGDNDFQQHIRTHYAAFPDFILHATTGLARRLTLNQWDFVADRNEVALLDFVGRFESFQTDYGRIAETLGLAARLKHLNRTAHPEYRSFYDETTREIVRERYRKDIERFGYDF